MRHLALLVLTLIGLPAMALTNVDLYHSEVVLDQTVDNADALARIDGMKEVIVRVSGDSNAISNEVVQKAFRQSSQYLSQISYGQRDEQPTLKMGFSAPHIRSLLSQAQLPVWPSARANLLVWLVEESVSERAIVWEHSPSETLNRLNAQASKRGLPLTLPVGDFDDITSVEVSDLWGGFALPVGQASQRYPVDGVLVVKVQGNSLRWTLYDQKPDSIGITRQAPISGSNNGSDAATKVINQISDYYAKKSAVVVASESSESIKVRFTELNDAVSFFTLENGLKKLSSVASLDILKIQGNHVTFNVHLLSSQQEFEQEVLHIAPVVQLENAVVQPIVDMDSLEEPFNASVPVALEGGEQIDQPASYNADPLLNDDEASLPQPELLQSEQILQFEWQGKASIAVTPAAKIDGMVEQAEQTPREIDGVVESDVN